MQRYFLGLFATLLLLGNGCTAPGNERPNIVFVLVDDMNTRLLPYLPRLAELTRAKGMSFAMTVPTPVCAPSRATILTGKYAHNTSVTRNGPRGGGIWGFQKSGSEASTFAVWLHEVGYRTGFFGKYLNEHGRAGTEMPPGWDRWVGYGKMSFSRVGFETLEDGGVTRAIGKTYDTDFFAREAAQWVATAPEPFLAVWMPMAPHGPFVAPQRHRGRFDDVKLTWPPSFSADPTEVEPLTRTRLEMMLGIEDGLAELIAALEKRGALARTYVVFTSDHGLFMGEHGFAAGKGEPYEETTQVPLFVRGPGVPIGSSDALVASTDLAPTFAAIAGAPIPPDVDGRSFLPLLHGQEWPQPRKRFLLEWWDPDGSSPWLGLRTAKQKFVRYADGTCKSFQLDADPYEMQSGPCDDAFAKQSASFIDRLVACSGASCVAAESE